MTCTCDPVEKDGNHFVQWVGSYFSDCVYSTTELAAFCIGMSSLGFWIACQMPQLYKNYQRGSAEALSFWFLLEWLSGDTFHLLGCILTNALPTQFYTAILFCVQDGMMLSQYIFLTCRNRRRERATALAGHDSDTKPLLSLMLPMVALGGLGVVSMGAVSPWEAEQVGMTGGGRVLMESGSTICNQGGDPPKWAEKTGIILGWISSVLYLNSRLPQIYKNFKRKTCDGLSWQMFFCAVMGNTSYVLGIVMRTRGWENWDKVMPWLPGSAGTLLLDITILSQYFVYNRARSLKTRRQKEKLGVIESLTTTPALRENVPRGLHNIVDWTTSPGNEALYMSVPKMGPRGDNLDPEESPAGHLETRTP